MDLTNISILFIRYMYAKGKASAKDIAGQMEKKGEGLQTEQGTLTDALSLETRIGLVISWFESEGVIVKDKGAKWKFAPGKRKIYTADLGKLNGWQNYSHIGRVSPPKC